MLYLLRLSTYTFLYFCSFIHYFCSKFVLKTDQQTYWPTDPQTDKAVPRIFYPKLKNLQTNLRKLISFLKTLLSITLIVCLALVLLKASLIRVISWCPGHIFSCISFIGQALTKLGRLSAKNLILMELCGTSHEAVKLR